MVRQGLPWKAQGVKDRIDKLGKKALKARKVFDNDDEQEYETVAASIYDYLRATWERALEDVAFFRVVQRHRDYIETKHLKKVTVLTEADCNIFQANFKKCCGVIDAHDQSRTRNAGTPTPDEMLTDIQALGDWVSDLGLRQKSV